MYIVIVFSFLFVKSIKKKDEWNKKKPPRNVDDKLLGVKKYDGKDYLEEKIHKHLVW